MRIMSQFFSADFSWFSFRASKSFCIRNRARIIFASGFFSRYPLNWSTMLCTFGVTHAPEARAVDMMHEPMMVELLNFELNFKFSLLIDIIRIVIIIL